MTKILKTLCITIVVIISTIFLPVRFLMAIVAEIIGFLITVFASKSNIGVKEYFSRAFDEVAMGVKFWWNCVIELYEKGSVIELYEKD